MAVENLHITLAFLGVVEESMLGCFQAQAREIYGEPFKLSLTQLGYFPRPRIIWLGPTNCPPPLHSLVVALNSKLQSCGFRPDARNFSAHVTLFRKAIPTRPNILITPVEWSVDRFYLIESKTHPQGVQYHIMQCYPLNRP